MDEFCRFFSEARGKLEKSQILEVLSNEEKQEIFYTHVFDNELEKDYPLGIVAIKNLLKTVVSALEGANIEVHGGLYEKYIASLSDNSTHEWRHYDIRGKKLPLWTSSKTILQNGTTGLSAWPAAWALAEFSAENCGLFSNKKILELGSGLGVGGIMLSALTKPREITLTDVHSEVLELLEKNSTVTSRITGVPTKVTELDWCSYEKVEEPEVVIGADLLYDPAVFPDLVKLLSRFSCPIYIAATIRNAATWNEFRKLCSDEKLEIIELEYDVTKGTLFHFDRNRKMRAKWRKKRVRRLKRKRRKMRARSK